MNFYSAFGDFSNKNVESFTVVSEEKETFDMDYVLKLKADIEGGKIKKDIARFKIEELAKKAREGKLTEKVKIEAKKLAKKYIREIDGINLLGDLELGGVMKAHGYYLTDGTKVNEIVKKETVHILPKDKKGNFAIDKKVTIDYNDKSGDSKLDIVDGKRTGKGNKKSPTLYVTGTSHPGANDQKAIAEFRHSNQTQGVGIGYNTIYATGSNKNQDLNLRAKGRGKVQVSGEVRVNNPKNRRTNPRGMASHLNYLGKGLNYIRGNTELRGDVNVIPDGKGKKLQVNGEVRVRNPKNRNNRKGWGTHFNYLGRGDNYIRGKTEIRGDTNIITNGGAKVHGHGKFTKIGPLNKSWSHFVTNAPQFYMNRNLQINGGIASYNNKPINAFRGVSTPQISRVGGDWLRINNDGKSPGQTALYGNLSINATKRGKGGLSVGRWASAGNGNIYATDTVTAAKKICVGKTCMTETQLKRILSLS